MSDHVSQISDAEFEQGVLQNDLPVLVDFWAEWCGPCKMIAPIVDEFAADNAEKIQVYKMNVDENPQTPARYGVRGIPSLLLFKGGELIATKVGAIGKLDLQKFFDETN